MSTTENKCPMLESHGSECDICQCFGSGKCLDPAFQVENGFDPEDI
jgi:hypothetical protein